MDPAGANFTSLDNPFYWVVVAPSVPGGTGLLPVLVADETAKAVVGYVDGGAGIAYHWFQWDANDQFFQPTAGLGNGISQADFEKRMWTFNDVPSVATNFDVTPYESAASGISQWVVNP